MVWPTKFKTLAKSEGVSEWVRERHRFAGMLGAIREIQTLPSIQIGLFTNVQSITLPCLSPSPHKYGTRRSGALSASGISFDIMI